MTVRTWKINSLNFTTVRAFFLPKWVKTAEINFMYTVTKRLAISSVIRRHDSKVSNRKIDKYNNLLHDLCDKYRVTFINNDDINCNLLNHSKLHLNREGDRVLGSAFCTYLKAHRNSLPRRGNNYNQINHKNFFYVYNNRRKDWLEHLQYVNYMTRK